KTVRWTVFEEGKPCKRGFPFEKHGRRLPQTACGLTGSVRQEKEQRYVLDEEKPKRLFEEANERFYFDCVVDYGFRANKRCRLRRRYLK
ncbi:MAG: hypothetical protein IJM87_05155, partial [Ruminococcus sp.]|nr:hypothetical protein [Ruminococcus sp.]